MKIIGKIGDKTDNTLDLSEGERFKTFLRRVAERVKVAEGVDAIEDILRCIYRNEPVSTKRISQYTKLPLPVVSRVRSILERSRVLKRDERGAIYTEYGRKLVEDSLKFKMKKDLKCPTCKGRGIVLDEMFKEILRKHREYAKLRPTVNTRIDQSHATPETAVYRAALMADRGDLEGKRILFIGDDDLTSIPTAMTRFPEEVVVMDIDERLLNLIEEISKREGLNIETVKQDFREELDRSYWGQFDTVFTDPPYTLEGLKLFLSRGVEGLGEGNSGVLYLAFSHKPIEEYLEVQRIINSMNFAIYELIPGFNTYEGSEIIGNTTFLARLVGKNLKKFKKEDIDLNKLYTGDVRPTVRYYRCLRCNKIYRIDGRDRVIEDLTCECGSRKFRMIKREKIKEREL
ncbi:MAG TPA: putative methyltransferase [Methanothermococcus okinawensis]|uniref:Putative methyltransferase n=1 Tax=Methanothermococcus okinawensis TaxID=155863 RepID=A0A832ZHP3_9EURY|nr:putative methyltransferase [Methanococcaceae archaeon]HIP84575.1 putative methyltransferase [Methanothermococcus okinawensis]HIP91322.1 putative methyltransferase [Methanothermococcus okinawensis]